MYNVNLFLQYKVASIEDRKTNLLVALKNSRFREMKHLPGSMWALKSDFSSSSAATTNPSATSTSNNASTPKYKSSGNIGNVTITKQMDCSTSASDKGKKKKDMNQQIYIYTKYK